MKNIFKKCIENSRLCRKNHQENVRQKPTHPDEPFDDGESVLIDAVKFVVLDEGNPSFILDILDLSLFGLFLICKFSHPQVSA